MITPRDCARWTRLLLALAAAWALALPAAAQEDAPAATPQRLKVGDAIQLDVVGYEDDLNGVYRVGDDGNLRIPFVGKVPAVGLGREDIAASLRDRIWSFYINKPDVEVTPLYTINVLGFVREPGPYHIEGGERVSDLLALAGGAAFDARLQRTRITRDSGEVIKQNLARALEQGSSLDDIGIRSGDTVYVPQSQWYRSWRNWATIVSTASLSFAIYDRVAN